MTATGQPENSLLKDRVQELLDRLLAAGLVGRESRAGQEGPNHVRFLVARLKKKGMRIEIHPNDHNPPHFHVRFDGYSASYCIRTLRRLAGTLPTHLEGEVLRWARENQERLLAAWESTRPTVITAERQMLGL